MGLERLFGLSGKVAVVTGGNGGIGLGYAEGLAEAGADLVIWGRNEAKNNAAAERLRRHGGGVFTQEVNVTHPAEVSAGFVQAVAHFGRVDAVFANAGSATPAEPIETTKDEVFTSLMDLNVNSVFYTLREAASHMVTRAKAGDPGGSIVITGSLSSIAGLAGQANYTASKHAVTGIMRATSVELGKYGVRVNLIAPGLIQTALLENPDPVKAARIQAMAERTPIPRLGLPEDFAGIAAYLASDAAKFVSGSVIVIDGAWSAKVV